MNDEELKIKIAAILQSRMNNEELKIKIAEIIQSRMFENGFCADVGIGYITAIDIADALIAAGIGDVKEAKHRAEVTERALYNLAKEFVDMQGYEKWDIAILAKGIVVPDYIKQAEKELSEEM